MKLERYKKRTFTILVLTWITLFKNGLGGVLRFRSALLIFTYSYFSLKFGGQCAPVQYSKGKFHIHPFTNVASHLKCDQTFK